MFVKRFTQNLPLFHSSSWTVFRIVFVGLLEKRVEEDSARVPEISENCNTLLLRVGTRPTNVIWGQTEFPPRSCVYIGCRIQNKYLLVYFVLSGSHKHMVWCTTLIMIRIVSIKIYQAVISKLLFNRSDC